MKTTALPANEAQRLAALHEYGVLDTAPDASLDAITRLATTLCAAPISLLTLVDREREWHKSIFGTKLPRSTPREASFSTHVILANQILEVPDTQCDERFASGWAATDFKIRSCIAVPLITSVGYAIGSLSVLDRAPRKFTAGQRDELTQLAQLAMTLLEAHKQRAHTARLAQETALRESESRFRAIASNTPGMVFQSQWGADETLRFSYVSEGCLQVLGLSVASLLANPAMLQEMVLAEDRAAFTDSVRKSAASLAPWNWEGRLWMERYRDVKWVSVRASPRPLDGDVVWEGIITNITKNKQTEMELAASREQLRSLSAHIMAAREQERTRLAREIHDDLGGNLSAIKFVLNWLANRIDANQPEVLERVRSANAVVDRSMQTAQQIARDLRPAILDCGIVAAVQWQAEEFRKRVGMRCEVICSEAEIALQPEVALAVFRLLQEALTNIAKHAHASRVQIHLQLRSQVLELQVIDNGRGIEQDALSKANAFGIRGMMERSDYLSGKLSVSRAPGGGTVVRLTMQVQPETHNQQGTDRESSYR